ncbi:hypothetical protein [Plasmodium yoelii yoelii]|uniref:Uncharacterized protein n=1 Tax=Plasmodium yoelii yoelii TaxID=73239 RepID=Q7RJ83_PLAYO|nr:hypothetical protein [Plasmodium yoelii yoelii]
MNIYDTNFQICEDSCIISNSNYVQISNSNYVQISNSNYVQISNSNYVQISNSNYVLSLDQLILQR